MIDAITRENQAVTDEILKEAFGDSPVTAKLVLPTPSISRQRQADEALDFVTFDDDPTVKTDMSTIFEGEDSKGDKRK